MAWINGYINDNQVQTETGRAILVKFIGSDWLVWIPSACVRRGSHKANLSIGVIDDKEYKIFRNGKGRCNKFDKIAEETICGADLAERLFVHA